MEIHTHSQREQTVQQHFQMGMYNWILSSTNLWNQGSINPYKSTLHDIWIRVSIGRLAAT